MNRKICVITGTRAEYGLLRWVMQGIKDDPALSLQVTEENGQLVTYWLKESVDIVYRGVDGDGESEPHVHPAGVVLHGFVDEALQFGELDDVVELLLDLVS